MDFPKNALKKKTKLEINRTQVSFLGICVSRAHSLHAEQPGANFQVIFSQS